jgi:hypothetical protein
MFFLQQNWKTRGWNRFYLVAGVKGGGGPNNVYTCNYKNNKIKFFLKTYHHPLDVVALPGAY